jgi:hypothetical protein
MVVAIQSFSICESLEYNQLKVKGRVGLLFEMQVLKTTVIDGRHKGDITVSSCVMSNVMTGVLTNAIIYLLIANGLGVIYNVSQYGSR